MSIKFLHNIEFQNGNGHDGFVTDIVNSLDDPVISVLRQEFGDDLVLSIIESKGTYVDRVRL